MTKKEFLAWIDTCPTHSWDVVELKDDYIRVVFQFGDPEEEES